MENLGIYYIENTIDEYKTKIVAYFKTLEEAMEGIKSCSNWFRPLGTGEIYFKEFGLNKPSILVYKNY